MTKRNLFITIGIVSIVLVLALTYTVKMLSISGRTTFYDQTVSTSSSNDAVGRATGLSVGSAPMVMKSRAEEDSFGGESITLADDSQIERLIIKNGNFSIVVDDVNVSIASITDFAEKNGGYVINSHIYKRGLAPYGNISVKIPVSKFDSAVSELKEFGEITSEQITGNDVTEEFVDLDAQLYNLKRTEQRYLEILNSAKNVEEIMQVENALSNLRNQIERIQGRMKYLRQSADFATINMDLSTDPDELPAYDDTDKWKPFAVVKEAYRSLVVALKIVVNFVIWMIVYIPVWLIIGLVVFGLYRLVRYFIKK